MIRDPRVLASDLNRGIRVKFEGIKDLGFSNDELANPLCAAPAIFTLPRSNTSSATGHQPGTLQAHKQQSNQEHQPH